MLRVHIKTESYTHSDFSPEQIQIHVHVHILVQIIHRCHNSYLSIRGAFISTNKADTEQMQTRDGYE